MKWLIILFVITLVFLVIFKFLYFGESIPILNLSNNFGNNSQTSFYLNGSIFSLIFIGDEIHVEDDNNFANLLNLGKEKEDVNFVDFLTNSLTDIISNEGDSSFSLEQVLSNSNITTSTNPNNLKKLLLLNGSWNLDVKNGNIVSFDAKISTINKDGISPHMYEILNLIVVNSNTPIKLSQTDSTIIEGRADIITPDNIKNIGLYLILQENSISIILDPKILGNDYNGQPIYGLTNYIKN
ncbi:MAG TPA: hypothetical protein VMS35_05275 [Nitrososphaeraceae archaeon]|nr:hypothetical protein [Nitrososphaeraceae archaeon]